MCPPLLGSQQRTVSQWPLPWAWEEEEGVCHQLADKLNFLALIPAAP